MFLLSLGILFCYLKGATVASLHNSCSYATEIAIFLHFMFLEVDEREHKCFDLIHQAFLTGVTISLNAIYKLHPFC